MTVQARMSRCGAALNAENSVPRALVSTATEGRIKIDQLEGVTSSSTPMDYPKQISKRVRVLGKNGGFQNYVKLAAAVTSRPFLYLS